jgi:hypothetical protein
METITSQRSVASLPLSKTLIELLLKRGFISVSDLVNVKSFDLSRELGIDVHAAQEILNCTCPKPVNSAVGGLTLKVQSSS